MRGNLFYQYLNTLFNMLSLSKKENSALSDINKTEKQFLWGKLFYAAKPHALFSVVA